MKNKQKPIYIYDSQYLQKENGRRKSDKFRGIVVGYRHGFDRKRFPS